MEIALIEIKKDKAKYKTNILVFILAIVSLLVSNKYIQPQIFNINSTKDIKHVCIECIFFILLLIFYHYIIKFVNSIKNKQQYYSLWLKKFIIFSAINCIFLMLIWPGHWVWDEMTILEAATNTQLNVWQSYITVIYYSLCMMVIPYACGVTIIQSLFIAFVMSYISTNLYIIYKKKWISIILYLIMIIPSIALNNLRPLRLQIYTYIMLLALTTIIFDKMYNRKLTLRKSIILLVLTSLLILWRSEGIIFCIFMPVLMLVTYYKNGMNYVKTIILIVVNIMIVFIYNNIINSIEPWAEKDEKQYGLTIYINSLSQMIQEDLKGKNINENLENINRVLNLEVLKEYPSYTEIPSFWNTDDLLRENFEENLLEFKKSYIKIVLDNPTIFLKARIKTFLATCYYEGHIGTPRISLVEYYIDPNNSDEFTDKFLSNYKFTSAINAKAKIYVETFLCGKNITNQGYNKIILYLFWNVSPLIIICIINIFISLKKRRWEYTCILLALMCNVAIIFLTAPANYFMYYLPMYVSGIVINICFVCEITIKKQIIR